ncbi:E3 ubiquitin-protein ligase MARCHF5-like isoform X2 [Saccostrea echinata]|uniref:E3 ubiquitin-protein ligase MARCHF5-like isoform X2 n=1 Tax=Saccostrea echinata TaxID=191078 RepID=UPI002A82A629|nr:E3 ubiquitin-protein ligase MARCHF5-like isoform X2 [Saccostrea echinata]
MAYSRLSSEDERKCCWVCFATVEDDWEAKWVKPCRCRGTTKWVHQSCLQRWVDEKQKGNSSAEVFCPQCGTRYIIVFPEFGSFLKCVDTFDKMIQHISPFGVGMLFCAGVYWSAFTYGFIVVLQVMGTEEGYTFMEEVENKMLLLISMPLIPVLLILGRMVQWEEALLKLWRRHAPRFLTKLFTNGLSTLPRLPADTTRIVDPVSATRIVCGALVLPSCAVLCGNLLFRSVRSNMQRTMMGGISFIAFKGAIKMYYKQQQYIRQARRVIKDYDEDIPLFSPLPHHN